ncbi:hypothetical protein [Pseudomonas fluorescens]|uniref:HD domain-containing protein n=1 Tax=Pseudomonas fluorescens TaxID=294 RepID=A0A944HAY1_PSEFL|nr:hypothetical protein [Pseudomonas fluorescens]MBT2298126.1 hypothetical protein [Pseudomonas fluorescens]MBT2309751.1 hypothetical protein [Pseudomonas fluorescens]MBT2314914.1 hypothetical protein [Pseudomonas fluorescens]MBT2327820.1 hypothetical protein [Pseudomonas fluorescens]MBT2345567.1 hypothetical protein [Pseudomonas fluorescens]
MITKIERLDDLLQLNHMALGPDFLAYRNHVYRIINFCSLLSSLTVVDLEKVAIAGAFHDLGIWTHKTFDYLAPSEGLAKDFLEETGRHGWCEEIIAMIQNHHKILRCQGDPQGLMEIFRKADWVDVTHGLLAFGITKTQRQLVFGYFPDKGFHLRLLKLSLTRLLTHPFSPLPMMRL